MKYAMLSHRNIPFYVYPRPPKGVQYYRFEHEGVQYHKSTKLTTRKEAIPIAQEAIDKILDSRPSVSPIEGSQSPQLAQVVSGYLEVRKPSLKPSTRRTLDIFFRRLNEAFGTLKIDEISIEAFHAWMNKLHAQLEPEASYWRDNITRYNQFFKWCILTRKMTYNPLDGYPRPKSHEFSVYQGVVEKGEFDLLCAHVSTHDELAIRVMRYMGIYPKDFAYATKESFYMLDGILHFHQKRGKNHLKFRQPLDGRIEALVKAYWMRAKLGERIFWEERLGMGEKDYRNWYSLFERRYRKVWEELGLGKPKKFGAFRHTFITEAVERGVPEDVLLEWCGYSKGSTILRSVYVHRKSTASYRYVDELHH